MIFREMQALITDSSDPWNWLAGESGSTEI